MLTNLFSSFDSKNYMMSFYFLMSLYMIYSFSSLMKFNNLNVNKTIFNMFLFKYINKNYLHSTMFLMILLINLLSLNLYNFSLTSHMTFNLPLILMLWMPLLMINSTKKMNNFLTHLVPMSTPNMLAPMMVIIEMVSFIIRPLTLFLRLSINMIAGHVLVTLLSNTVLNMNNFLIMPLIYLYMMLKFMVSFIQAYIISTLINMYTEEI